MARLDRINLSTRPFYNDRAVHALLALAAAAVLAVSAFNLWEVYVLSGRHAELQGRIAQAHASAMRGVAATPAWHRCPCARGAEPGHTTSRGCRQPDAGA